MQICELTFLTSTVSSTERREMSNDAAKSTLQNLPGFICNLMSFSMLSLLIYIQYIYIFIL